MGTGTVPARATRVKRKVRLDCLGGLFVTRFYATTICYSILMYYVYLLECTADKSWYIGYSANLKQRIERHNKGEGARTTSRKKDWVLIYYEAYLDERDAEGRERFLKSGSGRAFLKKQLTHFLT